MKILVVDDDAQILDAVTVGLQLQWQDATVLAASDGEQGLRTFYDQDPDVVVLDVTMPRKNGFEVLQDIRRVSDVPVIILTARGEETDQVRGLELGADDYVTKPFSLRELLARIRAVLRRPGPRRKVESFAFGDARLHPRSRQAFKAGREVVLTRKEFELLQYLLEHPGEILTRDRLLNEVWGYERFPTTRTVDTHVLRLRQKFETDPERPRFSGA